MKRFFSSARLALLGLGLATVAACVVNISFDMPQDVQLDATGTTVNGVFAFDLGTIQVVQQHKADVQTLSLNSVDATVTAIGSANKATSVTGKLALRPDGGAADGSQDIKVGDVTNLAITQGATFHLPGNTALDSFMLSTIKGSGKFSVVISGITTGGEAHLTLHVVPHIDLGYGGGIF
jgi:hypothetical protein